MESIRMVGLKKTKPEQFSAHLADCIILTKDKKVLMQQRPESWGKHAGVLNIFGGHVEKGETILEGLIRELHEELGAAVKAEDVVFVGAITEDWTDHTEIVHVHFWHDKDRTITGCYEAEARARLCTKSVEISGADERAGVNQFAAVCIPCFGCRIGFQPMDEQIS